MEKWTIRPDPTPRDPRRHVLLLKGSMKDVTAILKKFGSSFGRPGPASAEGYNLSIVVHELGAAERGRLEAALREMSPVPAPVIESAPELPPIKIAPPPTPVKIETPPPAPVAKAAPAEPTPEPTPAPVTPPPATPAPATPARAAASQKPLWDLAQTPEDTLTFDSLLAGPYNRFAHAASASVVSAPGAMYNPLFLYGAPGTGKTHMIHAVARSLGQSLGAPQVLLTSGSRLSRAASLSLAENRGGELQNALARAKALLVDDVHLVAVTETNRAFLAKLFAGFLGRGLQVVMTSIYPPRALASLEEALGISLGKGWSVDLKLPPAAIQIQILQGFFDRNDFNVSSDDAKKFLEKLGPRYADSKRWMRRLIRLKRLEELAGKAPKNDELLVPLFDEGKPEGAQPAKADLDAAARFTPPAPNASAKGLAILRPKGQDALGAFAKARFLQASAESGVPQSYRVVLEQDYDAQEPFGVPFQLGEACGRVAADAALIIGPPAGSKLAERESDFTHAAQHILEALGVKTAWIAHNRAALAASFLRAHLDLAEF